MVTFDDIRSPRALVCQKQHRAASGVGTVWFVCLADGYLIDCGAEAYSQARANLLAATINAADPSIFNREGLASWRP